MLTWTSFINGIYQLTYQDSLASSNWINLGSTILATGSIASYTNTFTGSQRFYRIALVP